MFCGWSREFNIIPHIRASFSYYKLIFQIKMFTFLLCLIFTADTYYGKLIDDLSGPTEGAGTQHGVSGKVYAIDDKTLWVRDFSFDGNAPGRNLFIYFCT